ncbi:uncharacterized protein LOC131675985 [Topomyia yanbarensis]|uniref:uncharacterized protein LOC131675985 n=1 Tax=Topomyia yanbarensis TaxID=2498891 RepID=UPI00273BF389|nr:uncharacterized protein LOC131675985 [Topomyia yanbarensis]
MLLRWNAFLPCWIFFLLAVDSITIGCRLIRDFLVGSNGHSAGLGASLRTSVFSDGDVIDDGVLMDVARVRYDTLVIFGMLRMCCDCDGSLRCFNRQVELVMLANDSGVDIKRMN